MNFGFRIVAGMLHQGRQRMLQECLEERTVAPCTFADPFARNQAPYLVASEEAELDS